MLCVTAINLMAVDALRGNDKVECREVNFDRILSARK